MIPLFLLLAVGGFMQAARSFATDTSIAGTELAFGYLLLAAYLGGRIISRFGLPRLTGSLLVGVLSGPFVLGLATNEMTHSLKIVNDVATAILGLTAGGEMNLKRVRPLMRTLRAITFHAIVAAMFVLSALVFVMRPFLPVFDHMGFEESLVVSCLLGVALAAQSPTVAIALLSETRADGPLSRLVLATVVVADLVVVTVYSLVGALTSSVLSGGADLVETVLSIGWELFGSMAFGVVVGMVIGLFLRHVQKGAALFALMVCLVVAEIGGRMHLDALVVMVAAGVWLENFSRADAHKLLRGFEAAELPVYLVFFALAGRMLNLDQLVEMIIPVTVIALVRGGVFYFGCRNATRRTGADPAIVKYAWTGLVSQSGLSIALIAVIQKNFPTFGPSAAVLLLSVVAMNLLVPPVLLRRALVRTGEAGKRTQQAFAASGVTPVSELGSTAVAPVPASGVLGSSSPPPR